MPKRSISVGLPLDSSELDALENIVFQYAWDEHSHWKSMGCPKRHIYMDFEIVYALLKRHGRNLKD